MNSKPESWGVVQSPTAECVCFPKPEPVSIMMMSARLYKGLPCSSSHSSFGGKGIVFWKVCHRASNSSAHIGESQKGIKGMQHSNMFWHCFIDSSPRIHWSFTLAEPCFFTQTPICVTLVLRGIAWYCMTLPGSTLTGLHLCHSYPEINISHVFLGPDLHVITLLSMSSHLILDPILSFSLPFKSSAAIIFTFTNTEHILLISSTVARVLIRSYHTTIHCWQW